MADKNYEFFMSQLNQLCIEHPNKFVVIKDCAIIGIYDTFEQAYTETIKTEVLGTFLIQQCSSDGKDMGYFHYNNVI